MMKKWVLVSLLLVALAHIACAAELKTVEQHLEQAEPRTAEQHPQLVETRTMA